MKEEKLCIKRGTDQMQVHDFSLSWSHIEIQMYV